MQTWEYMLWDIRPAGNTSRVHRVNHQEPSDWLHSAHLSEALNQAGSAGWELVAAGPEHEYIFKRPKSELESTQQLGV
jgi:hypothetical protein